MSLSVKPPPALTAQRKTAVVALRAAGLNNVEIAGRLGISTQTVGRDIAEQEDLVESIDAKLIDVQAQIGTMLTIERRVAKLAKIAEESEMDFASIAAIKYINELDGIHPELERLKVQQAHDAAQSRPMFILQSGSVVNVALAQPSVKRVERIIEEDGDHKE